MKNIKKIILLVFLSLLGCNQSKSESEDIFVGTGIYTNQNYTDLVLTQGAIDTFFITYPDNETIVNEVNHFYRNRNYQYAWFNEEGMTSSVPNFYNQLQSYSIDFDDRSFKNPQLDTLITLIKTDKSSPVLNKDRTKKMEILLTTTFFKYSEKVFSGTIDNPFNLNWFIPKKKKNYQLLIDSLVLSNKGEKIWEPANEYYIRLKNKLRTYREIQKKGGFPNITTNKRKLLVSESDSCIVNIKQSLYLMGDLKKNDSTIWFTNELADAVASFQHRLGLNEDGVIGNKTLRELNRPIDFRIKQIMINMERLRWFPEDIEPNFLLINIPEFKLHVFEGNKKIWDTKVVVGKAANKTSIFKGSISQIILNPYWNVPNSIVRNEILPDLKRNPSYLAKNDMEVLSGTTIVNPASINWNIYKKNIPYSIRQKPGKNNALGKIKFVFPNNFSIYLHDTPAKSLFNETARAFSHGCIRVEEPKKLALYLLRKDNQWDEAKINGLLDRNKTFAIPLKPTMDIYIVYFTAWVDQTGQINFRDDLYGLDNQLENEIFNIEN